MPTDGPCRDTHIVLTGPMGSGKTTAGRLLARRLGRPFYDSDAQIEAQYGTSSRLLAEDHGVDWLHRAEARALTEALAETSPGVVAAAASIGELEGLDRLLGDGVVTVLLEGETEVLAARARAGRHRRPLTLHEYRALARRRHGLLGDHVDLVVDVTLIPPEAVVEEILEHCRKGSVSVGDSHPDRSE